ncbi:hypothetical protein [Rhizobium oryziradicis]|uniref:VWFA domain-containing protein n=1 Tax=Rhizobium oryziradicis TaxID=1867956 RepID=A0A1Q8ZVS4_9HYPH|nr:hypothetical protein [Rhizobium oryziradicis]OLP46152.1 hypothetical protein BJF95_03075 [Rhizobium oryziradicis]
MGNGRWSAQSWAQYAHNNVHNQTRSQIFSTQTLLDTYNPAKIKMRESRASADNPHPTPIILASDVTGSMGMIAEQLMRDGLNTLAQEIYGRKPISDPHIMIMAVGDAKTDSAPLQVTQFEADIRVAEQARELWLEGGGGGNGGESYCAAHLFAAMKTATDAAEKENRKGFLFTIGDEPVHDGMTRQEIERVMGIKTEKDLSGKECVALAQRNWEVFHIVLTNEGFCQSNPAPVLSSWQKILPERTIKLSDVNRLAETIISLIQVNRGADPDAVASSWSDSTAIVVSDALKSYGASATAPQTKGIRRLLGF